ncbi:class I SAM-dependent methyltransferase, partial [bacterium]|nr:class I SAM-dependent methyltransferase [bacterium]
NKLEKLIKNRFDELYKEFPGDVLENDIRVKTILNFFGDVRNKKVLDVGCGKGRFSKILINKGAYITGVDISDNLIREAKKIKGGKFSQCSITNLKFPDETFDFVFSVEVLEHIPDVKKAIYEMVRVLKKDGKIAIIDKNKFSLVRSIWKKYRENKNKWFYSKDFPFKERVFSPWEIRKHLLKYFNQIKICYLGEYKSGKKVFLYILALNISNLMSKIFPFTSYYLAWLGEMRK